MEETIRCKWSRDSELLTAYHDEEWGQPAKEDTKLFECLTLEMFQAGLSWRTILHKRENFRKAFCQFHIEEVMAFTEEDIERLLQNEGIVRHRRKIEATIDNAQRCNALIKEHGSLLAFFEQLPVDSIEKRKAIKQTFKHIGLTTAESFLMATGMMPPQHEETCHLYKKQVKETAR
ncbi:DNA-3-methyladenine glycosylase I [Fictibacillus terranigra]|uniref:DNA-3-methyladenine glycosylase I n=1 Tax=Fictibacillus terranigra TaxID=3058424 RepID=A0ABT8EE78_9BACL|nr:DNA-3-methyladenine glycosylase I [Fictibacillus sp. CENA-BCM004]MDN4076117.1 DNA-3-methyladenine glycosylase I [Fictibacillus sp. CENA-BCM004]